MYKHMSDINKSIQKLITFSPELYLMVKNKAQRFGMSVPEYIRVLAVNDIRKEVENSTLVSEDTEERIGASLSDYQKGNHQVVNDAEELDTYLEKLKK